MPNASGETLQLVARMGKVSPGARLWVLLPLAAQAPKKHHARRFEYANRCYMVLLRICSPGVTIVL